MPTTEINELTNSFVKDLMPIRIYLFGSFAEGKQNADSDFDFIVTDTRAGLGVPFRTACAVSDIGIIVVPPSV